MSDNILKPAEIVDRMMQSDFFSKWLGLHIEEVRVGYCRLHYDIKEDMLNGFGTVHGGILFSASDSALAFASNGHGKIAVALEANISFAVPVHLSERLVVEAKEIHSGNKTGIYEVNTINNTGNIVCAFRGTTYKTRSVLF